MVKLILIAGICFLSAALSRAEINQQEAFKDFMKTVESCKGEVGASETDIEEMIKQLAASSMAGKCLRACVMKHFGVLDDSGKFVKSVAMKHAEDYFSGDADKIKLSNEIVDACEGIAVPSDSCEAAEAYGKCIVEQGKTHGMEKFKFEGL